MAGDKMEQENAQWKSKYFDTLREYERDEKCWKETGELLRKAVSRLALAAEGIDNELDRYLLELRNAVREHSDNRQLREQVDAISRRLARLDTERSGSGTDNSPGHLADLLNALTLPKGVRQKATSLKKKLAAEGAQDDKTAVKSFAELIHLALELSFDDVAPPVEDEDNKGVFRRLFSGSEKAQASTAPVTPVAEVLVRLLERLSLPEDFSEQTEKIREQILHNKESSSWDDVLEQIAELVQKIRSQTRKEKQGIEEFMLQLSERLQGVDRQLQDSEQYYDDTQGAGQQLDSAVKAEIGNIGSSVRSATSLDQMKSTVQTHVDSVLQHLEKNRQVEQQRYAKAKQKINEMSQHLHDLETETGDLRARLHEEQNQAKIDALTCIPNRLAWEERLEEEIARHKRFGTPLVLLVWDIDKFKSINDRFGHRAGDKVLHTLAQAFLKNVRETDFVARYGGEEFVVLMTGSSEEECMLVADKLRNVIKQTGFHFRGESVVITASCGIAGFRQDEDPGQWFERADKAMYRAKEQGRNRCEIAL